MNWISIKDKYPPEKKKVLLFIDAHNWKEKAMEIGSVHHEWPCNGNEDNEPCWHIWDYVGSEFTVLYWITLPKEPI